MANYTMTKWKKMQQEAIYILKEYGYKVWELPKVIDYMGIDIVIGQRKIDIKAEATSYEKGAFPDTILLSVGWSKDGVNWHLPKYLEHNDIDVWIVNLSDKKVYIFTPSDLDKYRDGNTYDFIKPGDRDYFGRQHKMVVINKKDCRQLIPKSEIPVK